MSQLKSSYDTTVCRAFPTGKLVAEVKRALLTTTLSERTFGVLPIGHFNAVFVSGIDSDDNLIPPFIHPVLMENIKGETFVVSDIRAFKATTELYPTTKDFERAVKNKSEYSLAKGRAVLELRWAAGDTAKLKAQLQFAGSVFGAWISQAISKTYALDLNDQLSVVAIAIYYYHGLFTAAKKLSSDELEAAVIHTINATSLPAKDVYALFDGLPEMSSPEDLCEAIKTKLQNVRLRDLNHFLLLNMVKGSWYGMNATEMIGVALEYPVAWISIVYAALTEKTYRNSQIYRMIEIQAKRSKNVDAFKMNYQDLVERSIIHVANESIDNEPIVIREFE